MSTTPDSADRADLPLLDSWSGAIALYLLIAILATIPGLGSPGIVKMEGQMVDTAETMLETSDYLVPMLYGEIYTYKPPLVYWLMALSIKAFGLAEWVVRLPGAVSSLVMGLVILILIGRVARPRVGFYAALAATTGLLWNQHVKVGEFDTVLASLVGIAIVSACYNLAVGRSQSSGIWLLAYVALAAGLLAKGAPALMAFGPGLLGAAVISGQKRQLWSSQHLASASLFIAIVAAYLAMVWNAAGAAAFTQPMAEAGTRGFEWTLETFARTLAKPLMVLAAFLPWSLAWPWSLGVTAGSEQFEEAEDPIKAIERLRRAAWAFLALGVLVFMAVPTHESRYYLPLAVPAAVVSALALERLIHPSRTAARLASGLAILFGIVAIALPFALDLGAKTTALMAILGTSGLIAVWLLARLQPRQRIAYILFVAALCAWAGETFAMRPYRAKSRVLDAVARAFDAELPADATVWALGEPVAVGKNSSLYYYLDRPVRTFVLGEPIPPHGSYVVLRAIELRRIEESSPNQSARLREILRVPFGSKIFLLCRVESS